MGLALMPLDRPIRHDQRYLVAGWAALRSSDAYRRELASEEWIKLITISAASAPAKSCPGLPHRRRPRDRSAPRRLGLGFFPGRLSLPICLTHERNAGSFRGIATGR